MMPLRMYTYLSNLPWLTISRPVLTDCVCIQEFYVGLAFIVLAVLPMAIAAMQVPHMLVDYVMASSIEDLISEETLHSTVLQQKTRTYTSIHPFACGHGSLTDCLSLQRRL